MQIKETANKGLKREFHVTVPAADIDVKTQEQLKQIGKSAKIAGFRPGHVPMPVLKKKYGKSVMGEVLEKAVHDAQHKLIDQQKLRPAMQPNIKVTSFDEGKDLEFDVSLEVFPEVPEIDLSKIEVTKPTFEIDEKDQNEALERLASRNKTRKPKGNGAKAAKGDVVIIDFKGLLDDVAFPGGTAESFNLELGSGQFIPGFEDQLIDVTAGDEVKVSVTFPAEYHSADLAGKPVVFEVKVHDVMISEAPKVDDEFAKGVGFDNLAALRETLKSHLGKDYEQYARNRMKKDLFDQLEEICDFEVPEGMIDSEFRSIWAKLKQAQAEGDESVKDRSDDDLKEEYRGIAVRRVRLGIFLAELGRKEKIEVTRQELMNAVVDQARMFPGQEQKVVEFYQKNPTHIEELRGPIFEDKVVDFVFSKAKTKEQKVSLEELVSMDMEDSKPSKKKASKKAAKKDADDDAEEAKKPAKAKK